MDEDILYDEYNRPILSTQHPEEDHDYVVHFATELSKYADGDTIDNATVTAERGVTVHSVAFDDTSVAFWLKLGKAGNSYVVKVVVTTVIGRTHVYELVVPFGYTQVKLESYE